MILLPIIAMVAGIPNARLIALQPNLEFPSKGHELVKVFHDIDPQFQFQDLIASWNVEPADSAAIKIEVQAHGKGFDTRWYTMGEWSLDGKAGPRESVSGQKDQNGSVDTDTLQLKKPADGLDVRVTLKTVGDGERGKLKLLTFALTNNEAKWPEASDRSPAWGKTIDVPQRAQGNYPNGGVLCSPTSLSMVLWHYSNLLGLPGMNKDVPEVQEHVWDPAFKGAGNWPFNTAYAGSFAGLLGYVARFGSVHDLEKWIDAGFPVICSVSFDLLRGLPLSPTESGHLVVLVGFSNDGDPIFNDPAFKDQVRKTYKRDDFVKAWAYSKETVYLVYPEGSKVPTDADGLWIVSQ